MFFRGAMAAAVAKTIFRQDGGCRGLGVQSGKPASSSVARISKFPRRILDGGGWAAINRAGLLENYEIGEEVHPHLGWADHFAFVGLRRNVESVNRRPDPASVG
jgi:hypothetical protein